MSTLAAMKEGARWFAHGIAKHPAAIWINRFRAPTLLLADKIDEAKSAFTQLTRKHPDLSIPAVRHAIPYTHAIGINWRKRWLISGCCLCAAFEPAEPFIAKRHRERGGSSRSSRQSKYADSRTLGMAQLGA
jgi:hypothetical protein